MPAKSKAQQRFMGMVHSAQKGGKAASPEVAKVAKNMKKKDAKDFASTAHKGLPGHVDEKKEPRAGHLQLTTPETHQLKVARQTLKMADTFVGVMGGPSKAEAREIIKKLTGKGVKEQKIREYVRKAVREALVEARTDLRTVPNKKYKNGQSVKTDRGRGTIQSAEWDKKKKKWLYRVELNSSAGGAINQHYETDLTERKKTGHGRRKIGSKKRRAIKKRRDARKLRR